MLSTTCSVNEAGSRSEIFAMPFADDHRTEVSFETILVRIPEHRATYPYLILYQLEKFSESTLNFIGYIWLFIVFVIFRIVALLRAWIEMFCCARQIRNVPVGQRMHLPIPRILLGRVGSKRTDTREVHFALSFLMMVF